MPAAGHFGKISLILSAAKDLQVDTTENREQVPHCVRDEGVRVLQLELLRLRAA